MTTSFRLIGVLLFCSLLTGAAGYEVGDIQEFIKAGQACFEKKDYAGAALEFENVLLMDPRSLEAKVWLCKTYLEQKNRLKAKEILGLAQAQDPTHPDVLTLEKLLGGDPVKATHRETDLVLHETLTLLGERKETPRPFGLVIPEDKVRTEKELEDLTKDPAAPKDDDDLVMEMAPPPVLEDAEDAAEGPLIDVFDAWALEGLGAGLEKYFEIVGRHRSLGMLNDKNLLREGEGFFKPRLDANPKDEEAGYFMGMITYFNGDLAAARKQLEPLRHSPFAKSPGAKIVFGHFDRLRADEEAREQARIRAEQKKEEERLAAEQAKADALAAAQAAKAAQASFTATTEAKPAPAAGTPEAMDTEGYDLYKKGQLDPAIEKFNEAIRSNDKEPKFHYHLGLALTDKALGGSLTDFEKAVEAFNNVIRLEPGSKLAREAEIMIRDIQAAKNSLR